MSEPVEKRSVPARARRHDLDALRGFAMLLGIVLHVALAYVGSGWVVNDTRPAEWLGVGLSAIHGFRMPLFFVMSGFFTAMLCHRRGIGGMLVQRARRIALPLAIGSGTIVPLMWGAILFVFFAGAGGPGAGEADAHGGRDIWTAAAIGDADAVRHHLAAGADLDAEDPVYRVSPLGWAAIRDHPEVVELLLASGADPNARYGDGYTALHSAAFFGRAEPAALLLEAGADPGAADDNGETPSTNLDHDRGTVVFIAGLLGVEVDFNAVNDGREQIRVMLADDDAETVPSRRDGGVADLLRGVFIEFQFFSHLWFLWHLCLLVAGYAVVAVVIERLPRPGVPAWLSKLFVASPLALLWLAPLTMVPQLAMQEQAFGPDTTASVIPLPHVLAYYAVFFGFGAMLHGVPGGADRIGRAWWLTLPAAAAVFVPAFLARFDMIDADALPFADAAVHLGEVLYAWLTIFGLMGLFRVMLARERPWVRYLSDASYWLYLVHLPPIIIAQWLLRDVDLPGELKFVVLTAISTAALLLSYQIGVRYTAIGAMLNGRRTRPARPSEPGP